MSATTCRACGGYVGHAVPHFCDLDALAGPIRRRAFDAMDAMPPNVSADLLANAAQRRASR